MKKNHLREEILLNEIISGFDEHKAHQSFFKTVDEKISQSEKKYIIASINVENFAILTKWHGAQKSVDYTATIVKVLKAIAKKYDGVFSLLDGNEFGIVLPNTKEAISALEKGCQAITKTIDDGFAFMPAIGAYEIKDNTVPTGITYSKAQEASRDVYQNYKSRINFYSDEELEKQEKEVEILLKFKEALKNDELQVFLQPKVDIISGKIVGAESLVRWICKDGTIIYPNQFIPVLEKYGIMYQADKFCWEKLICALSDWKNEGIKLTPISINVSRSDLLNFDVPKHLKELAKKYNVDPNLIRIEITESVYTEAVDKEAIGKTINTLKKQGFSIFMDDFGSGYSSLSLLKNMKFDAIKMDMEFLAPTEDKQKGLHILEAVVRLCHDIGLPVVVEGVETIEQENYLKSINCIFAQGYKYYKPMPMASYKALIQQQDKTNSNGIIGYWKNLDKNKPNEIVK